MGKDNKKTRAQGNVLRVVFHNPDNGYSVIRMKDSSGREFTAVGLMEHRRPGEKLQLQGKWKRQSRWGLQFEVDKYRVEPPDSKESLMKYLASDLVEGIGPEMARRLVEHFGDEVLEIIRNQPSRISEVSGIGKKRSRMIVKAVMGEDREKKILRELSVRLMGFGVGESRIRKIYKQYGGSALDILNRNPYQIYEDIDGFGFVLTDRLAAKMNIAQDSKSRIEAGIKYRLSQSVDDGHCYLPRGELVENAANLLGVSSEKVDYTLSDMVKTSRLIESDGRIYQFDIFYAEQRVAVKLAALMKSKFPVIQSKQVEEEIEKFSRTRKIELTTLQKESIRKILSSKPVAVLTGGPGTGKTTAIDAVAHIASKSGLSVKLCAPTGRAAKRLAESTGMSAYTIHRLLGYKPQTGFEKGESRKLSAQFIVLDEASMVDIKVFSALMSAIKPGCRLLIVGDVDQLPSVGPGQILRDIIESGRIPTIRLNVIHRQAAKSRIIMESHNILHGKIPDLNNYESGDFFFISQQDREMGFKTIIDLVSSRLPEHYQLDARRDIQVIVPMYKGICGANALNDGLKERLNPDGPREPFNFSPGDKVMQIRNNYELDVFNGDIGIVNSIDSEKSTMKVLFDRPIQYNPAESKDLTLAYAITIHKSQGSEMPCVVIPLYTEHFILLKRNLLYTAITRAKKVCVIVGQEKALYLAINKYSEENRYSGLQDKLSQAIDNSKNRTKLF